VHGEIVTDDNGHVIWDSYGLGPVERWDCEFQTLLQYDCTVRKCPNGTDVEAEFTDVS